jgi:nicotinate-nucleotide pyrophosphorylase (carboxylating)
MTDLNTLSLSDLFAALTSGGLLTRLLELARDEDLGPGGSPGDITALATPHADEHAQARVVVREPGRLSGGACIAPTLRVFAPSVSADVHIPDGAAVHAGQTVATLSGPLRQILAAERTLLNLTSRLSGIATRTAAFVARLDGLPTRLLDTRKTTPGLRALEKYAVRCGGGFCHRVGLYDAVLIKDNHIAAVPLDDLPRFVTEAAARARAATALRFVELEVDRLDQLDAILRAGGCGLDIVLLDNMAPATLRAAVNMRNAAHPPLLLEASGGVRLDTLRAIAETGVDRISVGGLTHQATSLDLGLDIA